VGAIRAKLFEWAVLVSVAVVIGTAPRSFAQEIAPTGEYKEGLAVGNWLLYPKVYLGAVWDSNTNQSPTEFSDSGVAVRLVPDFRAVYDGGIHKSTLYGVADARFFNSNTVSATTGFTHVYEAMRDLVFTFQGNYTRQTDLFTSALNFNNGAIGPNISTEANVPIIINPFGTTPSVNPTAYNQFTLGGSVAKDFNNAFAILSGTVFHIAFDNTAPLPFIDPFLTSHDGTSYWVTGRAGYNVNPQLYVFAESSGIFQRFNNSIFDTNGYRVVGGFGNRDPQSLIRGEVYGGYQAQDLVHDDLNAFAILDNVNGVPVPVININGAPVSIVGTGIPSNVNSAIFGGRLYYYPTRYWTLVAAVDQTLGISTTFSPTIPAGTPTLSTNAILQSNYAISQSWSIGGRVGYSQARYYGISRLDNGWLAGASFNYEIWRNLLLTLDYQWSTVRSDAAFADFTRNAYTAGLTYKY
jgi:hypothetical protein